MNVLTPDDKNYPALLRSIPRPPTQLYSTGNEEVLSLPSVSVVGSRRMSAYGEAVCRLLIPPLVQAGLAIVSGLAYGVDGFSHRLTLKEKGTCIAVLGSGLAKPYPTSNHLLLQAIIANGGCALSEYPPEMEALPYHFPERNRIIAGLSRVVLIVEAGERSGTLGTARHALDSGREVCVVPADITRIESAGSFELLKQGARPVTCVEDILELYQTEIPLTVQERLKPALTGSLATLYDSISRGIRTTDALLQETGLPITELQSVLSVLELDGYICYKQQQWQKIL